MDAFGQHGACSQPGYSYTKDLMDMSVYSGHDFNLHQQKLHQPLMPLPVYDTTQYQAPNTDPFWWFGGSAINHSSSFLNENGSSHLQSGYVHSQPQVLTPAGYGEPEVPCLPCENDYYMVQIESPPYSYSALIAMAFLNKPQKSLTFRQICEYVADHVLFCRINRGNWQKAIVDSLSLNECFLKVGKNREDPVYGDFWILHPNCDKIIEYGKFQRKLHHKRNVEPLRSDDLDRFSENKINSPTLDTSPCFEDILSTIDEMTNGASTTENFSPSELCTYPTDPHNVSLFGISIGQANVPQALASPNHSSHVNPPQSL